MTAERVASATISGVLDEPFALGNGVFDGQPYVEGASSRPRVMTVPGSVRFADIDGDGQNEATAVLLASTGGSGSFFYLVVIDIRNGIAENAATVALGDRIIVKNVSVSEQKIVLDTVEQGAHDPMCCPTMAWRRSWLWGEDRKLSPLSATRLDYATSVEQPVSSAPRRFRGKVVWGHEMRSFKECSTGREAWVSLAPGAELTDDYERLASEPYQEIFMEVDAVWSNIPREGFGADFAHSMLVSQVRRAEREGFGCDEKLDGIVYRARGNEPSWRLDVREDRLEFSSMDGERTARPANIRIGADSVQVVAGADNELIDAVITAGRCVDSMSGSVFAFSAAVSVGGRELSGCAINGF